MKELTVKMTSYDIDKIWENGSSSLFLDQPDRYEIFDIDEAGYSKKLRDSDNSQAAMLWVKNNYLNAAIVRDFHRLNGHDAVILWDIEISEHCVWVDNLTL